MGNETFYHALKINSEVCTGCTHCMNVCPTAAIRIKYGKATINEAACTDCGMCLKTCPRQAIYVEQDDFNQIFKFSYRTIPGRYQRRTDIFRVAQPGIPLCHGSG